MKLHAINQCNFFGFPTSSFSEYKNQLAVIKPSSTSYKIYRKTYIIFSVVSHNSIFTNQEHLPYFTENSQNVGKKTMVYR